MRRNHSIIPCSRLVYILLFFAHIPFMVNYTFNRNPTGAVAKEDLTAFVSSFD